MNILVTSIGDAFAADIVIKRLRANQHVVIGCDSLPKEWIADALNVDYFVQSPQAMNPEQYLEFIISICHKYDIQFIMPLSDLDIDAIIDSREWFKENGICICTSDKEVTKLCRDKFKLIKFLDNLNICTTIPTTLLSETRHSGSNYPILAKPRFGRGSEGVIVVRSKAEFRYLKVMVAGIDYLLQPLIQGNILNVDVVRNRDDYVVCIARRDLIRHPSGVGTAVEIIRNQDLNTLCVNIAHCLDIVGAANFEFIEAGDQLYFMEINPRFSGGVEFSCMAGYDVVINHLRCFCGQKIEEKPMIKRLLIARKYEEYITKEL